MSSKKCSERLSLLSTAGLTTLAMLMAVPGASAQGTPPPPLNFQPPADFQIPPAYFGRGCTHRGYSEGVASLCVAPIPAGGF